MQPVTFPAQPASLGLGLAAAPSLSLPPASSPAARVPAASVLSAAPLAARPAGAPASSGAALEGLSENLRAPALRSAALRATFDGGASAAPAAPDPVGEYSLFLEKVGFRRYKARVDAARREADSLLPHQRRVLEYNSKKFSIFDTARESMARVMGGVAAQGYSEEALENAIDLAARLLSLRPLAPPEALPQPLPAGLGYQDAALAAANGLGAAASAVLGIQLSALTADILHTMHGDKRLEALLGAGGEEGAAFAREAAQARAWAQDILLNSYLYSEASHTRYAGRALASALHRYQIASGRADILPKLEAKLASMGFHLGDYLGRRLSVRDRSGRLRRLSLATGDEIAVRSKTPKGSEITSAVLPHPSLWWRALRRGLIGNPIGILVTPAKGAEGFLNAVRRRVAGMRTFLLGYSHTVVASVESADGVDQHWAYESDQNSQDGMIQKVGLSERFLQPDVYAGIARSRLHPERVRRDFIDQAKRRHSSGSPHESMVEREELQPQPDGSQKRVVRRVRDGSGLWPAGADPERSMLLGFLAVFDLPGRAFLRRLNSDAIGQIERMMCELGVGYSDDFSDRIYRVYCSWMRVLAYKMAGFWELQSRFDRYNPLTVFLKYVGYANAKDLNIQERIIAPGYLMADPKVRALTQVRFPARNAPGTPDPNRMDRYAARHPDLVSDLDELLVRSGHGGLRPASEVAAEFAGLLLLREAKRHRAAQESATEWRAGLASLEGFNEGLEAVFLRALDGKR